MFQVLCFLALFAFLFYVRKSKRLVYNPYKLIVLVGKKGAGKTLRAAYLASKAIRRGKLVYTNFGVGICLPDEYWKHPYPPDSVIFIDEAGLVHDNRNFKSFPPQAVEFYKYQRKNKLQVYLISQSMDIDLKIRVCTDALIVCKRLGIWTYGTMYQRTVGVVKQPSGETILQDTEKFAGLAYFRALPSLIHRVTYDTDAKPVEIVSP